jgi:hypothetical protein
MYTRAPTTVGLASSFGAGFPLTPPGVKCHARRTDAAFAVVNAVAALTDVCCGPCKYCGQSVVAANAGAGAAAAIMNARIERGYRNVRASGRCPTKRRGKPL